MPTLQCGSQTLQRGSQNQSTFVGWSLTVSAALSKRQLSSQIRVMVHQQGCSRALQQLTLRVVLATNARHQSDNCRHAGSGASTVTVTAGSLVQCLPGRWDHQRSPASLITRPSNPSCSTTARYASHLVRATGWLTCCSIQAVLGKTTVANCGAAKEVSAASGGSTTTAS